MSLLRDIMAADASVVVNSSDFAERIELIPPSGPTRYVYAVVDRNPTTKLVDGRPYRPAVRVLMKRTDVPELGRGFSVRLSISTNDTPSKRPISDFAETIPGVWFCEVN